MLQMWLTVMFLEDIPQFCIQLIVITNSDGRGLLRFIAWVSLGFTFIAFVWRGICEAACPKALPHETSLSHAAHDAAPSPL